VIQLQRELPDGKGGQDLSRNRDDLRIRYHGGCITWGEGGGEEGDGCGGRCASQQPTPRTVSARNVEVALVKLPETSLGGVGHVAAVHACDVEPLHVVQPVKRDVAGKRHCTGRVEMRKWDGGGANPLRWCICAPVKSYRKDSSSPP